jgi:RHS repeat-associated protein
VVDAKNEAVSFNYDANGFLLSVQGPLPGTNDTATFTYDAFNRVQTTTDTEGYTVTYSYDDFDRPTLKSFPDGTSEQFVYNLLDLVAFRDRLGRWTTNSYNANRQLLSVSDPLGRLTRYEWCKCGLLEAMIDPLGRTTTWTYDVQSRPIAKTYPDGSTETYSYENSSGRLSAQSDALGQQVLTQYNADNTVKSISYLGGTNPTPTVSFTYDPDYNRVLTMQDGVGITVYSYNPITPNPSPGAGQLQSLTGPLPSSTVTFQYDVLGRVVSRAINGAAQAVTRDVLGRTSVVTNALGSFQYSYLNATPHLTAVAYPNGQTTQYSYYNNAGDQQLQQILNLKPNASLLSGFGYAYNAVGQIVSWTNQWDALPTMVWNLSYDDEDQLIGAIRTEGSETISSNSYAYDFAANRTTAVAGGTSNSFSYNALNQITSETAPANVNSYEWDAAHRLTAINESSHRSEFTYDGLDRRTRIVEKENGVVVANNCFLWCGTELCEELDATGTTVVREFFPQGETLLGAGGTTNLFYTRDHLGSIREASDSTGTIQARYDYDPYGVQTVLTESLIPSFAYTGHFQHKPSGLYLALFRGLDPNQGRWLNRDPLGEAGGQNLYAYVNNNPIKGMDLLGLCDNSVGNPGADSTASPLLNDVVHDAFSKSEAKRVAKLIYSGVKDYRSGAINEFNSVSEELNVVKEPGALAFVGAAYGAGKAVVEDYQNGAGVVNTYVDANATFSGSILVGASPPAAMLNLVTAGAAGALVDNGLKGPAIALNTALSSRVTSRQQAAVKSMLTRNWATKGIWRAGEWLADKLISDYKPPCK